MAAAEADDCYRALKLVRRIIRHEDAVIGRPGLPAQPAPPRTGQHEMQTQTQATRAYQAAASHRSLREQQADVFRHFNGALRAARGAGADPPRPRFCG